MTTIRHFPNFAPNLTLRSLAASSKGTILLSIWFLLPGRRKPSRLSWETELSQLARDLFIHWSCRQRG